MDFPPSPDYRPDGPPGKGPPAAAVRLDGVGLTLTSDAGPVRVLDRVDLAIAAGETVAVAGPSGSGKTSMLMVIAGLEAASDGSVEVAGRRLDGLDEDTLVHFRRDAVGIVFQDFHLVPTMTALENVAIPLEFAGRGEAFERARDQLAAVGLDHRLAHYPSQLSGGERQRVALARAFVVEPAILLADEPTGNLDGRTGAQVMDLLFELQARRGTTLVLVTHEAELAARCGRVVHMLDGRIVDGVAADSRLGPR